MLNGIDKLKSIAETVGRERWTNYMSMSHSKRAAESTFPRAEWCDLRSYVETKELDKLRAALRIAIKVIEVLRAANDFYGSKTSWELSEITLDENRKPFWYLRTTIKDDCEEFEDKDARGGKRARQAKLEADEILKGVEE